MQGFQLLFITEEGKRHHGQPVVDWLIAKARELGIEGLTTRTGVQGIGRDGKVHSAHFIELNDQPVEVMMAVSAEQCEALFKMLEQEQANLFYVKTPAEFGVVGQTGS